MRKLVVLNIRPGLEITIRVNSDTQFMRDRRVCILWKGIKTQIIKGTGFTGPV